MVEGQMSGVGYGRCHICLDPEIVSQVDDNCKPLGYVYHKVWSSDREGTKTYRECIVLKDVCNRCYEWARCGDDRRLYYQLNPNQRRPINRRLSRD